jgi:hypothetical protein
MYNVHRGEILRERLKVPKCEILNIFYTLKNCFWVGDTNVSEPTVFFEHAVAGILLLLAFLLLMAFLPLLASLLILMSLF